MRVLTPVYVCFANIRSARKGVDWQGYGWEESETWRFFSC
jgi:hypothetical protein